MPDFPPPPVLELEGDYTTWAVYDKRVDDVDLGPHMSNMAVFNEDETKAMFMELVAKWVKDYDVTAKTLSAKLETNLTFSVDHKEFPRSILGTYIPVIENDNNLKIYKNNVLVQTLTCADLGLWANYLESVSMSASGKYIVVTGNDSVTFDHVWVILEGS